MYGRKTILRLTARPFLLLIAALLLGTAVFSLCPALADEPAPEAPAPCDLMLIAAHPGDEVSFFSGLLSVYAGEYGLKTRVVYLSCASDTLREKSEAALAALGVTEAPEYLGYKGDAFDNAEHAGRYTDTETLVRLLTELIRKYKPTVVVTHDPNGEAGHGMHALCAAQVKKAVGYAGSARQLASSAKVWGTHAVSRLFTHTTDGKATVTIDRTAPLSSLEGRSALENDSALFAEYGNERELPLDMTYDPYVQGCYRLEPAEGETAPEALATLFDGLGGAPALKPLTGPGIEARPAGYSFPEDIFLPGGEEVVFDEENGRWSYRSENFSVRIDHRSYTDSDGKPIAYNVAHLYMRNENPFMPGVREKSKHEPLWYMARRYGAVIGITGDNMTVAEGKYKGIILRSGVLYNDRAGADTLAIMPDLSIRIYEAGAVTADDLIKEGIENTFSFGPSLIRGSVIGSSLSRSKINSRNPRCGIGMIEPGHLVLITVDGRQNGYSSGLTLDPYARLFYLEGCAEAYNLDGGRSVAMVFMGEHVNRHKGTGSDQQRSLPDALLWGKSPLVPKTDDPVYNVGYGRRETPIKTNWN